jgi:hypothetical protein
MYVPVGRLDGTHTTPVGYFAFPILCGATHGVAVVEVFVLHSEGVRSPETPEIPWLPSGVKAVP